jgi:death-on-curing protein
MRSLTIADILETYQVIMQQSGGPIGIRDFGLLESATAQPYMTSMAMKLYPSLSEKPPRWDFL